MTLSHVHLGVRDLKAAVTWFRDIADCPIQFENENMAVVGFGGEPGSLSIILDRGEVDAPATIALHSRDCDDDFQRLTARGATSLAAPESTNWGARAAYLRGPGALIIELEQTL